MNHAIEARGLIKSFGSTTALDGIDLEVAAGTVLGVLGPNGAGKTTMVRVLATLVIPDAGTARVSGFDLVRQARDVRRSIGLTGQYASVDDDLTGVENLVMIGQLLGLTTRNARARAAELLTQFRLTDAAPRLTKTYSGGMRRRLDLAASLVGRPSVLFLDEPTTGLDPARRDDVWRMIRSLAADGTTVLLTTQHLEEADALADEISVIDHGRVIAHDTALGLKRQVGGLTLSVRAASVLDLDRVEVLLASVGTRDPERTGADRLSVAVADDSALTSMVAALASERIAVAELAIRLPSLDEVFLSLTGETRNVDEVA